jgi:hypothetical protein
MNSNILLKLISSCIFISLVFVACNETENKGLHQVLVSADSLSSKSDTTQFQLPKNLYLVMLDMPAPKPALTLSESIGFMDARILPGYVYLDSLRKAGIPIFGGSYAVKNGCAFIIQANDNLQLQQLLKKCPLTEISNATILPLVSFGESLLKQKQELESLKEKQENLQVKKGIKASKNSN